MRSFKLISYNKKYLKIIVEGVEVEGAILTLNDRNIDIEIVKPYQDLSGGRSIPYFAIQHISKYTDDNGYSAGYILKELYQLGKFIELNKVKLKQKYFQYKQELGKLQKESCNDEDIDTIYKIEDDFFNNNFPMVIPINTRKEILEKIKDYYN